MNPELEAPARGRRRDAFAGWLRARSFRPDWLPARWQSPVAGYAVAALLQVVASLITLLLAHLTPTFSFLGLLELLVVALIAVTWGVGPSALATLAGAALLEWLVLPVGFGQHITHPADLIEVAWFLLIGLALSAVAGQTEEARRRAIEERAAATAREAALRELGQRTDEFLSLASHELRSPLTGIKSTLQLTERRLQRLAARETLTTEELRHQVEPVLGVLARAEQQVDRQNRLIGDLLDATRIRAGKLEFRFAPADLSAIVGDMVEEQRLAWPGRELTLDGTQGPIPLVADADRLGQVVTNLLTNALKYSPADRSVSVLVRREGTMARVLVRDQGPGLTDEQQRHVWERFHRVPGIKQQSGSGAGLGLGLYICRTIVERHGGEVGVESAPGRGSAFWFALPLS